MKAHVHIWTASLIVHRHVLTVRFTARGATVKGGWHNYEMPLLTGDAIGWFTIEGMIK
jgi:hypothetical protein